MTNRLCQEYEFLYSLIFLSENKFSQSIESASKDQIYAIVECIENIFLFTTLNSKETKIVNRLIKTFETLNSESKIRENILKHYLLIQSVLAKIFFQVSFGEICRHLLEHGQSNESN